MDTNKARTALGKKIREVRKANELTQEKLGEKSGLSYKFIGELERGNVNVSLDSLVSIAKALKIQVGDLFRKSDDKVLKVEVKEKSPLSKLSVEDRKVIDKAMKLMGRVFTKK